MFRPSLIAAVLAALPCSVVLAAEPVEFDPVTVTATRLPQPLSSVVADVSVISRKQIDEFAGGSVTDILQTVPGVEISTNGGRGQLSSIFLRGANSSQTVVLIDGVRVNSATSGGAALEKLPLDQVERIEVLRGPASSRYGADAIGGVVQVFTRAAAGRDQLGAGVGIGSDGLRQAHASLAAGSAKSRLALNVSAENYRGFSASNESHPWGLFGSDDDGLQSRSVSLAASHEWMPGQELSLNLLESRGRVQYDAGSAYDPVTFNPISGSAEWNYRIEQQLASRSLVSRNQLNQAWLSTVTVGEGVDSYKDSGGLSESRFRTRQRQLSWQNDVTVAGTKWSLALEGLNQQIDSTEEYDRSSRIIRSVWLAAQRQYSVHAFDAAVRHDDNSQFGSKTTGSVAYALQLAPLRFAAGYATAFRAPSFNDLYYPYFGNPDLKPETSANRELSVEYARAGVRTRAVLFRNLVDDLIALDAAYRPANLKQADLRGLGWSGQARLAALELRADMNWQDPRDVATDSVLPRRARRFGGFGASYLIAGWSLDGELRAVGERHDTDGARLPGYALVDLGIKSEIQPRLSLQMRATNLFDRKYVVAEGYNTAGRGGFVGVDYRFR